VTEPFEMNVEKENEAAVLFLSSLQQSSSITSFLSDCLCGPYATLYSAALCDISRIINLSSREYDKCT